MKLLNFLSILSFLLACASYARAGETVNAIDNPQLEPEISEAPLERTTSQKRIRFAPNPKRMGRDHWYDELNLEGDINRPKKKRVVVVEEDEPEYVRAPKARRSSIAGQIDDAMNKKIEEMHEEMNRSIIRALENMKVSIK